MESIQIYSDHYCFNSFVQSVSPPAHPAPLNSEQFLPRLDQSGTDALLICSDLGIFYVSIAMTKALLFFILFPFISSSLLDKII